jgi:hypothetical protein
MLNISAFLRNMRTFQSYPVKNVPVEISKLQIKGEFSIKFPLGFNRGISAEKVKFVKEERELLLNDYQNHGASANWNLIIYYKNLSRALTLTLDFTDFTFDAVALEIGFKITPLLDRIRNFEKTNEYISFAPPQSFNLKSKIPQNFQASFRVNDLWSNPNTLAGIEGEGVVDADGLEYNFELPGPDKDKAIIIFRVTKKSAGQDPSYFNLDLKFEDLKIRRWIAVGINLVLKLKADYLFYYTDGTFEYVNISQDSCTSSTYYTTANLKIAGVFPKNVDFTTLPSDPNKTLGDVFIAVYLEVDTATEVLFHAILITCDKIFVNHNFIQIDKVVKGVKLSDYFREINILAGQPIFDQSLLFMFDDIIVTTTNMMLNNSIRLPAKIMDVMEALSILEGFVFVEIDVKYFFTTQQVLNLFAEEIELANFTDVNYEPVEQIVDFEIGEDAEVEFKILPRLFEKRKYFLAVETFANLDTYTIKPKVIGSGELILNKVVKKKYDDDLLFLRVEQYNFGSFGCTLNQRYSNQNVINRLALLLNSFFVKSVSDIYYRNESNQVITHNLTTNNKIFDKFYRNIKMPADNAAIIDLFNSYKRIKIGNKRYLPVEYSLNLEPNTLNIKLLGFV